MDRKTIVVFFAAATFVSTTFASNILDALISKPSAIPANSKLAKLPKQTNRLYTDFSGTWNFHCDTGESATIVIENDADHISFNGHDLEIGTGLQGVYASNAEKSQYNHSSYEWNTNGSELIVKNVSVMKTNRDNSGLWTIMSNYSLAMKSGQIDLDGKVAVFEDLSPTRDIVKIHCTFDKKS